MFKLCDLPFAPTDLEPYISEKTLSFHYGKHHQTYVTNLNNLVKGTPFEAMSLTEIVKNSFGNPNTVGIFNNAAQDWNHTFYWRSMKKNGGGQPYGQVKQLIDDSFGSYEAFYAEFKNAALTQFGSGWSWLVEKDGKLSVMKTKDAENPITSGFKPLVTLDVWEHAYYLDYQNRRADYASVFLEKLLNWDYVNQNLAAPNPTL